MLNAIQEISNRVCPVLKDVQSSEAALVEEKVLIPTPEVCMAPSVNQAAMSTDLKISTSLQVRKQKEVEYGGGGVPFSSNMRPIASHGAESLTAVLPSHWLWQEWGLFVAVLKETPTHWNTCMGYSGVWPGDLSTSVCQN